MTLRTPAPLTDDNWRWRWIYFSADDEDNTLHRVAAPFEPPEEGWMSVPATMVCGLSGMACMPGFMSRMDAPRCAKCCELTNTPVGFGNPYNEGIRE